MATARQFRAEILDGKGRQQCCKRPCPYQSVRGLRRGQGLCPFHWAERTWGKDWARKCYPIFEESQRSER